jgi:hypothetical protein
MVPAEQVFDKWGFCQQLFITFVWKIEIEGIRLTVGKELQLGPCVALIWAGWTRGDSR